MKKNKFNEERLLNYANYLKKGIAKCSPCYTKPKLMKVGARVTEDKSLHPLFFLPIMELPIIFSD